MDKREKVQQPGQQSGAGEQNPTLQQAGTSVPDYGNVMGGASDENVEQEQEGNRQGNEHRSGNDNDTLGNP
jgi:hypothetical protein